MRSPAAADLAAARAVLERLGVSPHDLVGENAISHAPVPTFAEFVPTVSQAVGESTRNLYRTYWDRVVSLWGDREIDEPTPTEITALVEVTMTRAVVRRNGRGGRSAGEHMVAALRC